MLFITFDQFVCPFDSINFTFLCSFKISDIKEMEKIQKRATKLVIKLKNKLYTDRIIYLDLPRPEYGHLCGDMIEVTGVSQSGLSQTVGHA